MRALNAKLPKDVSAVNTGLRDRLACKCGERKRPYMFFEITLCNVIKKVV